MAVTRVHNIPNPAAVSVSPAAGEFLFFSVQAGGPVPSFQFTTDVKGTILNQGRFPQDPAPLYEWTYLRDPSDMHQLEILSVVFLFAANAQYRYQVSVNNLNGKLRDVLDIEYTGTVADFDAELFRVVIQ